MVAKDVRCPPDSYMFFIYGNVSKECCGAAACFLLFVSNHSPSFWNQQL